MGICEQINKLPKTIRDYIHELESVCPADLVQEVALLRENQRALLLLIKENEMTLNDFVTQFVEDLDFDVLIGWADMFGIDHDYKSWLDDDYPDKESELREQLVEAMLKVGV